MNNYREGIRPYRAPEETEEEQIDRMIDDMEEHNSMVKVRMIAREMANIRATKNELIEAAVAQQVEQVNRDKPPFRCYHEALAFLEEEVKEVKEQVELLDSLMNHVRNMVYNNQHEYMESIPKAVAHRAIRITEEAIDVKTVCVRWLKSLEDYDGEID